MSSWLRYWAHNWQNGKGRWSWCSFSSVNNIFRGSNETSLACERNEHRRVCVECVWAGRRRPPPPPSSIPCSLSTLSLCLCKPRRVCASSRAAASVCMHTHSSHRRWFSSASLSSPSYCLPCVAPTVSLCVRWKEAKHSVPSLNNAFFLLPEFCFWLKPFLSQQHKLPLRLKNFHFSNKACEKENHPSMGRNFWKYSHTYTPSHTYTHTKALGNSYR